MWIFKLKMWKVQAENRRIAKNVQNLNEITMWYFKNRPKCDIFMKMYELIPITQLWSYSHMSIGWYELIPWVGWVIIKHLPNHINIFILSMYLDLELLCYLFHSTQKLEAPPLIYMCSFIRNIISGTNKIAPGK